MARTGSRGGGKSSGSSGRSSSSSSSSGRSSSSSSSSGGSTGSRGGGKTSYSPAKRSPPPKPTSISTKTTQVTTSNTGRVNPRSQVTNNSQVATQNNPTKRPTVVSTGTLQNPKPKVTPIKYSPIDFKKIIQKAVDDPRTIFERPPPIRLETGKVLSLSDVKYTENPNQSDNVPTFDGFTIDISGDKIRPSIQKEFTLHLSGEKQIDPQRLQAIQEGRVIITEGIKTTFSPTDQQIRILQAMEKQKAQEKLQGKSKWQINQDKLNAEKRRMIEAKQKTEQFRNRSDEEILRNFIKVQTQKELAGDFGTSINPEVVINPTNLNAYLTKPETIPTSVLKKTTLDTAEKMLKAGLSPRIVNIRLDANNQVQNGTTIDTSVPLQKTVNFKGTGQLSPTPKPTPQVQTMFVPMIQHQATEPVGNPTLPINVNTAVNTEGIGGLPPTVRETTARTISNITEAEKINPTLPLLAGLFIFGM